MKIPQEQYKEISQFYIDHIQHSTDYLNSFWNSLNKLVISCSTGILFGSIAFVSLPFFREHYNIAFIWTVIAWIFLLLSILMLIIGIIEQAKFCALHNLAVARELNRISVAIQTQEDFVEMQEPPILSFTNVLPTALGFALFLFGTVLLVGALLSAIFPVYICAWRIGCAVICTLVLCWIVQSVILFFKAQKQ